MSFGASNTTKTGINNLGGISSQLTNQQLPMFNAMGGNLFNTGMQTTQPGVSFLNTVLQGNRPNTAALLQPNINDITGTQQATLRAINTLMPRGGGRYSSLFGQSLQPQAQIQNLFNPLRGTAATALPQIGLQQTGQGVNLFNLGNQALSTAAGASANIADIGQRQQQINNSLLGGIGGTLFNLATLPLGGAGGLLGTALGGLFPGSGGGGGGGVGLGGFSPSTYNAGLFGGLGYGGSYPS